MSAKTSNSLKKRSAKKLHCRLSTGLQTRIWLEVLSMWGVGRLQVRGIRSRRLVFKEVVEHRSNHKKCYFWWFGNTACGDPSGSDRIEKDQGRVSPRFAWGKGEKQQCDLVCERAFRWSGGFSSLGSWSYFKECVCNLGAKSILHCVREVTCKQAETPGI